MAVSGYGSKDCFDCNYGDATSHRNAPSHHASPPATPAVQNEAPTSIIPYERHLPRIFLFDGDSPPEATGLALHGVARGAVVMSSLFLGPALLRLAVAEAEGNCNGGSGHNDGEGAGDHCDDGGGRVYGMKPTSLLTNIGVLSGLLSSVLMPAFGSVVDRTPHRKSIGHVSAMALSAVKGVEIFLNRSTWFAISILQVVNSVAYNAYSCAAYAYTAELSTAPDEQTVYNSRFQTVYYASMLVYVVLMMATSTAFGTSDVGTARVSQTLAFVVSTSVFGLSWRWYFRPRPALRECPTSGGGATSPIASGLAELAATFARIWRSWDAMRYFLLSAALSESAVAALSTIATTYATHVLEMSSGEIARMFLCVCVAGVPGSRLGGLAGVRLNPMKSAMLCLVLFVINTTLAAVILTSPESKNLIFGIASVWGVCISWLHPAHVSLYCTIIPRGQESEVCGHLVGF